MCCVSTMYNIGTLMLQTSFVRKIFIFSPNLLKGKLILSGKSLVLSTHLGSVLCILHSFISVS